jgi:hypothetical protein
MRQGQSNLVCPQTWRTNDRSDSRKQIRLQYAGIATGYGHPKPVIIALADSDVAIRLGQIHQWVTPTNSRSRLLQQRAIAASGGVSQIAVMDAATRV